jgi:hypothetical protein
MFQIVLKIDCANQNFGCNKKVKQFFTTDLNFKEIGESVNNRITRVKIDQSTMLKLLLLTTLFVYLASSAPINCAKGAKQLEIMDVDENPCEDHNVCQVHCGIYHKNCQRTAYFNLDKFTDQEKTPKPGKPGYEEFKAYHYVCTQKRFTVKKNGAEAIFRIFNYFISTMNKIKWDDLQGILKFKVGSWDKRYGNLIKSTKMNNRQRIVIHSLQKLAIALRNFKKVCPQKNFTLKDLQKKFLDFENKYWQKMLKSTYRERSNDTGLRAYLKLKKLWDNNNYYSKNRSHYQRIMVKHQRTLGELKKLFDQYNKLAMHYRRLFEENEEDEDEEKAEENQKKAAKINKKIQSVSLKLKNATESFVTYSKMHKKWNKYLVLYYTTKNKIIQQVLTLFLNPKFQSAGGNYCQCYDFTRFATWNYYAPRKYLWKNHQIRKNVVDHKFMQIYLPAIKNLCKKTCSN